jgi:hypothetical protein
MATDAGSPESAIFQESAELNSEEIARLEGANSARQSQPPDEAERIADEVGLSQFLGKLQRVTLANGDHSYALPMDALRSATASMLRLPREAFVHVAPESDRDQIKIIGTSDRQLFAAMAFARKRWGDDEIIIHVGDKHREKVIEQAVRAGLNIANRDQQIQALVVKVRERQANAIAKEASAFDREKLPLLEHVGPAKKK